MVALINKIELNLEQFKVLIVVVLLAIVFPKKFYKQYLKEEFYQELQPRVLPEFYQLSDDTTRYFTNIVGSETRCFIAGTDWNLTIARQTSTGPRKSL